MALSKRRELSKATDPQQPELFQLVHGFMGTSILLALFRCNVIQQLTSFRTVKLLVKQSGLDPYVLENLLEFMATTTCIVEKRRQGFRSALTTQELALCFAQLEKYVSAYGPAILNIHHVLCGTPAQVFIDQKALAAVFGASRYVPKELIKRITYRQIDYLIDLGCGSATLLTELCKQNARFHGIGIEKNRFLANIARGYVRQSGCDKRVKIRTVEFAEIKRVLNANQLARITGIYGGSFLNEFFRNSTEIVVDVLVTLRTLFPNRIAWFIDYYGKLGSTVHSKNEFMQSLLHDVCQVITGQGVPAFSLRQWKQIYSEAGCTLVFSRNFQSSGVEWFIHEVELHKS